MHYLYLFSDPHQVIRNVIRISNYLMRRVYCVDVFLYTYR